MPASDDDDPVDAAPPSTARFAGALLATTGSGALLALASTGHGRVVTVVALAALLLGVLDAVASLANG